MRIRSRGQTAGIVVSALVAVAIVSLAEDHGWTWRLGLGLVGAGRQWDGWPVLSVIVVVAAWVNVLAWTLRIWPLAIACSLLTFPAPWGFLYPGILAGPILAVAAALAWTMSARDRRGRPAGRSPAGRDGPRPHART